MTVSTRGDRFMNRQLSRVDWGSVRDLKSSLTGSFAWATGSTTAAAAGDGGSGMAAAAAAVAAGFDAGHLDGSASDRYAPSSRYDPTSMNRIADIGDLAEDYDSDSIDVEGGRCIERNIGHGSIRRQALLVLATVGIIIGASFGIASLVGSTDGIQRAQSTVQSEQEGLLEIAQRVVAACDESSLERDVSNCQRLCKSRLCCFGEGEASCAGDEGNDCAAHAGCEALVGGFVANGADMSTGQRIRWG